MLFSDEFVLGLRDDPVRGVISLCERAIDDMTSRSPEWDQQDHLVALEAFALLREVVDGNLVSLPLADPLLPGRLAEDCPIILKHLKATLELCQAQASKMQLESFRSRFRLSLGTAFSFEFSQGDLERVQHLLNELRELITNSTDLEPAHRQRLLARLEKLQGEIHKKVSDLDRFWGLVGDAGVVLGKLGTDAKPIVDRIREITSIIWQTQSRSEELPSGAKLPSIEYRLQPQPDQT